MLSRRIAGRFLEGPPKSIAPFADPNWDHAVLAGKHGEIHLHSRASVPDVCAVMIAIHGWTSGVQHAVHRLDHLCERGVEVHVLEVRGHGESQHEGPWTAGAVVDDLLHVLHHLQVDAPLLLHGHSLGAYVCLRLFNDADRSPIPLSGFVMESPMTCYEPIFEEGWKQLGLIGHLPGLRGAVLRRLIRGWNEQHPRAGISSFQDVNFPRWGVPDCPTLVLQADPDLRLGPAHLSALIDAWPDEVPLQVWKSETLRHSGTSKHPERDLALCQWLEKEGFIPRR